MSKALSVVAIDMDEVLVETLKNLYAWHNETYDTELVLEKDAKHFAQWLNRGFGDYDTFQAKFDRWSAVAHKQDVSVVAGAASALQDIKSRGYRLVIITSRRPEQAPISRDLIRNLFPGIFDQMWFCAGFRDQASRESVDPTILRELLGDEDSDETYKATTAKSSTGQGKEKGVAIRWLEAPKSAVCKRVGAAFLVDDSIHNALEVVENGPPGIRVALFGDYLWNRHWTDMTREEFAKSHEERMSLGYVDDLSFTVLPDTIARCSTWSAVLEFLRIKEEKRQMTGGIA